MKRFEVTFSEFVAYQSVVEVQAENEADAKLIVSHGGRTLPGYKDIGNVIQEIHISTINELRVVDFYEKALQIAMKEIGVHEIAGSKHNPRILEYHKSTSYKATTDEIPWCASFVNWVLMLAELKRTNSAAAISFLTLGKPLPAPIKGCVTVSKRTGGNHVFFYLGENDTHVQALGGNQSDSVCIKWISKQELHKDCYRSLEAA